MTYPLQAPNLQLKVKANIIQEQSSKTFWTSGGKAGSRANELNSAPDNLSVKTDAILSLPPSLPPNDL